MAEPTVRVYDVDKHTVFTIPARELAPGMIRANVRGVEGEVWIEAKKLKAHPSQHPPFSAQVGELLASMLNAIQEVYPNTFDQWEEGFRRDAHPEQEIAIWKTVADAYKHFTDGRDLSSEEKQDIFNTLVAATNSNADTIHLVTNTTTLSAKQVKEIAAYLFNKSAEVGEIRDRLVWARQELSKTNDGDSTNARVVGPIALESLLQRDHLPDDDPRPAFRFADAVLGAGIRSNVNPIIFGAKTLESARAGRISKQLLIIRVSFDEDKDDHEKLCALCLAWKGKHEYDGTCVVLGDSPDDDKA